jgi:transcriptional regulator with GAF, ATPase, and Fis domain
MEPTAYETQKPPADDARHAELNRAIRDFALSATALDPEVLRGRIEALLREICETLGVPSCALIECGEDGQNVVAGYHSNGAKADRAPRADATPELQALTDYLKRQLTGTDSGTPEQTDAWPPEGHIPWRPASVPTVAIVPIGAHSHPTGFWAFGAQDDDSEWPKRLVDHLQLLGDIALGALHRQRSAADLRPSPAVHTVRIQRDIGSRYSSAPARHGFDEIVGDSPALREALARVEEVAQTDTTVLLLGETGTGKELFARALHARGLRQRAPLVSVNCAALPPTLIESELFGHQRGAFTGAVTFRQGRFELAHRGTLFLDEIGDLPHDLQAKLLRVLQEGAFERVGSSQTQVVDVRIIAATHGDLAVLVAEGAFRADLYYRLHVFPIRVPPLRERREDIPALVWAIIRKRQHVLHRHIKTVDKQVMDTLQAYHWPGNIRELENVVERALIHSPADTLTLLDDTFQSLEPPGESGTSLMTVERAHIEDVLSQCGWRINGVGNAAERLGLHPNTLRFRMKKLGIVRHRPGNTPFPRSGNRPAGPS